MLSLFSLFSFFFFFNAPATTEIYTLSLHDALPIFSVEALVRWQHPQQGLLPPSEFISIAQRTGLIKPLTSAVLDSALEQVASWKQSGLHLAVAVNLSMRSLLDLTFPDEVAALLDRWGVEAQQLQLEIT